MNTSFKTWFLANPVNNEFGLAQNADGSFKYATTQVAFAAWTANPEVTESELQAAWVAYITPHLPAYAKARRAALRTVRGSAADDSDSE